MIDYAAALPRWPDVHAVLREVAGLDPVDAVRRHGEALVRNEISSLLTIGVSIACLGVLGEAGVTPAFTAGYSVGQYAALFAANALNMETTFSLVWERAQLMNATRAATDGAMLAVVGLDAAVVKRVCSDAATLGEPLAIANDNSPGQMTLAGTRRSIDAAEPLLREAGAYRVVRLTVSGAWHCELLQPAAVLFAERLAAADISVPHVPVIDNVTGDFFPDDVAVIKNNLAAQLTSPVLWQQGVRRLRQAGAERFVEVGFGDMLTRFGFFIDRGAEHVSWERVR